jgi:prepilin-type N-terminal cleavage/methylation domain-containing protein
MNMIQKRQQMRGQSGFTLIELLVAIAILGILAGVAVFAVGRLTDNADTAACTTEKKTVETAIDASKAVDGTYPTTLAALTPDYMKENVSANWTYVVIPAVAANPAAAPPVLAAPETYTVVTDTTGAYETAC